MRQFMEGDTRKRKIIEEDDDEDEDIKIEKFYALIRSAKDIRDQLLDPDGSSKARPKKAVATEKKAEGVRIRRNNTDKIFATETAAAASAAAASNKSDALYTNQRAAAAAKTTAAAAAAAAGGSAVRNSRSSAEDKSKKTADQSNNYKGGRIMLDLNLSL